MKDMFLKKSDIYYSKWATVVQKIQLSVTKLGNHDEIRWFDGICYFFFIIGSLIFLRWSLFFYANSEICVIGCLAVFSHKLTGLAMGTLCTF